MSRSQSPRVGEHQSVLALPAVDYLITNHDGTYVDATFGRGGHSRLILERLGPKGKLVAFDRDPQAVDAAASIADPRFHVEHTPFSRLRVTLDALSITRVHGVLLDLGMSSPQIDDPSRGFSWRADGPLDMRMDPSRGETAAEWLAHASFEELAQVIREYGEERFAASIAKAIVARRTEAKAGAAGPLATTADLAGLVANAVGRSRKDASQHPATRTFQAVRIHVNRELEELALALDQAAAMLSAGGRLVAISFHSLEDRIVKRFIDAHHHPERVSDAARRVPLRADQLPRPTLAAIARVYPDEVEMAANSRARSAVMRVAERTAEPWPEANRIARRGTARSAREQQ